MGKKTGKFALKISCHNYYKMLEKIFHYKLGPKLFSNAPKLQKPIMVKNMRGTQNENIFRRLGEIHFFPSSCVGMEVYYVE